MKFFDHLIGNKPMKLILLFCSFLCLPVLAQDAVAPEPQMFKGDVAWMMVATLLVTFMAVPGLALFYGGLVRVKNMLSMLMQVTAVFSLIVILWAIYF